MVLQFLRWEVLGRGTRRPRKCLELVDDSVDVLKDGPVCVAQLTPLLGTSRRDTVRSVDSPETTGPGSQGAGVSTGAYHSGSTVVRK